MKTQTLTVLESMSAHKLAGRESQPPSLWPWFALSGVAFRLGNRLENAPFMEDRPYNLVVSTPGAKEVLTRDREFLSFKGFPVLLTTTEPFKKKTEFQGNLHVSIPAE